MFRGSAVWVGECFGQARLLRKYNKLSVIFIHLKSLEFKMKAFTTPPKETCNRLIVTSMPRQGDWICFSCNNLNFAFRKKCNRCKSTTREQNEQYPGYFLMYQQQTNSSYSFTPLAEITNRKASFEATPPKRKSQDPEKQEAERAKLPSVSPLVKRYRSGRMERESNGVDQENLKNLYTSSLKWDAKWDLSFEENFDCLDEFEINDIELEEMVTRIML